MTCDRCGSPVSAFTMSYFNTDNICMECEALEQLHPDYHRAKAAENEQVERGNFNYEGIGLPPGYREWARTKRAELAATELEATSTEEDDEELDLQY
jgi:hypothetical protein